MLALAACNHNAEPTPDDEVPPTDTDTPVPPSVVIDLPLDGAVVNEGELVLFAATITAAMPELLVLDWRSDVDGLLDDAPADAFGVASFLVDTLTVGPHTVTLTATDADGANASDQVSFVVNGLPSAPTVAITPVTPSSSDDLVAEVIVASEDPEGDPITYTWAWTRDGAPTAHTTETLPGSATTRGEVWEVTVTPNDGHGDGAVGRASVVIGNSIPLASTVTLSPLSPTEGSTLTCTASGTDADGDAISWSYAWTVDGTTIEATTTTLTGTHFDKGDVVACIATPHDGITAGVPRASPSVTIQNTPPSAPTISLPEEVASGTRGLTCAVTALSVDADGDAVTYDILWTVDGLAYPEEAVGAVGPVTTTLADDTVPAADTDLGTDWVCTVVPFDGEDEGASASAASTAVPCGNVPVGPTCHGETVQVAFLPGWGSTHDGSPNSSWPTLVANSLLHGDCAIEITSLGDGFDLATLSSYDVLVISNPSGEGLRYDVDDVAAIQSYLEGGHGGAIGTMLFHYSAYDNGALFNFFGIDRSEVPAGVTDVSPTGTVVDPSHPVTQGLPATFPLLTFQVEQAHTGGWMSANLAECAAPVIQGTGQSSVIVHLGPNWRTVYFTGMPEYESAGFSAQQTLYNAILWAAGYE